uniref:ribonuclease H-like domain-containing protein n=1 Tax=Agathobacter sp. TaxID=2021311 RepID=UPI004057A112
MKHICTKKTYNQDFAFVDSVFTENSLFFDIETTGFSGAGSMLYLIGCMHRTENTLIIEQFFAESKEDELEILLAFQKLLSSVQTLISFNGSVFDTSFLHAKCKSFGLEEFLHEHKHIDIFKAVKGIKPLLKLPNYKQKTIEQFLGISREDSFSGGELIPIYQEYLETHDIRLEKFLLLHNFEDILGMLDLLPILTYKEILKGAFTIEHTELCDYLSYEGETKKEYMITLHNHYSVPKRISAQNAGCYLTMYKETTKIRIPVMAGELRFFYPNYKDYFYLPKEDMAIHKSVAEFVDKQYRQKAKSCNCYTRRSSMFLPQYDTIITPIFRQEYKDKCCYFELNEDFLGSIEAQMHYIRHILSLFFKPSKYS